MGEALAAYQNSLAICQALGDRPNQGSALLGIGTVYAKEQRWSDALSSLQQSLHIRRELGDRHGEDKTLMNIGVCHAEQGNERIALAYWRQALALLRPASSEHKLVEGWLATSPAARSLWRRLLDRLGSEQPRASHGLRPDLSGRSPHLRLAPRLCTSPAMKPRNYSRLP